MIGIQLELSLVPLYDGGSSFSKLIQELEYHHFLPAILEPVFIDPELEQTLQVDAVFFRKDFLC